MKKLLFMLLCCSIFVIGCNNNDDEIFEIEDYEISEAVDNENKSDDNENKDEFNSLFEEGKKELEENNNPSKAVELFDKAIELNPNADWVLADRGRARQNLGDVNGAIQDFSKAIELNKRSVYYIWRANAYNNINNGDLAEADRAEAAKLPQE